MKFLTEEQEKLIPFYVEKWQEYIYSQKKTDMLTIENSIEEAYSVMEYECPEIIFANDLKTALNNIIDRGYYQIHSDIKYRMCHEIWKQTSGQLSQDIIRKVRCYNENLYHLSVEYKSKLFFQAYQQITTSLSHRQKTVLARLQLNTLPEKWAIYGSQSDFCISVLNCEYHLQKWKIFKALINCCGLIFCLPSLKKNVYFKETVIVVKNL